MWFLSIFPAQTHTAVLTGAIIGGSAAAADAGYCLADSHPDSARVVPIFVLVGIPLFAGYGALAGAFAPITVPVAVVGLATYVGALALRSGVVTGFVRGFCRGLLEGEAPHRPDGSK